MSASEKTVKFRLALEWRERKPMQVSSKWNSPNGTSPFLENTTEKSILSMRMRVKEE
jgi:hypothetical protein